MFSHYATRYATLIMQVQFAKLQPFLKTSVFSTLGATLSCLNMIFGKVDLEFCNEMDSPI